MVKNLSANAGDVGSIPGSQDPLEKEIAAHSGIPTWEIPWTEEPGRLPGRKRVGHDLATGPQEVQLVLKDFRNFFQVNWCVFE